MEKFDRTLLVPTRYEIEYVVQNTDTITRSEAIILGTILYWNGIPCERGHVSPRYTKSGHCKECYRLFRAEEIDQKDISKDFVVSSQLSVVELKRKLKLAKLSITGTKMMLIKRLRKYEKLG